MSRTRGTDETIAGKVQAESVRSRRVWENRDRMIAKEEITMSTTTGIIIVMKTVRRNFRK